MDRPFFCNWGARARVAELEAGFGVMIDDVQDWCDQITNVGSSWDDWDHHYKGFAYRGGGLSRARALLAKSSEDTPE